MRKDHLERPALVLIALGSGIWLVAQDLLYMVPVLGIVGSILALKNEKDDE